MTKPAWDISKRGEAKMIAWLDAMLDGELSSAVTGANSDGNVEIFRREIEPVEAIIQRLSEGRADPVDQQRAAHLLESLISPEPKKRGPKPKPKIDRQEYLTLAARDAVRIRELWREHYGQRDQKMAIEFACKRWVNRDEHDTESYEHALADLIEKVSETLRRPKTRNFGT